MNNYAIMHLDTISLANHIFSFRSPGGDHNRHQQLVVALFLGVAKVQRIIIYLIIRACTVFGIAALELQ